MNEYGSGILAEWTGGEQKPATNLNEFSPRAENVVELLSKNINYQEIMKRCESAAQDYSEAQSQRENRARNYLITIAECVTAPGFSIHELAELNSRKASKADERNPYRFLMRLVDPQRDPKIASRNSLALVHALLQCGGDTLKLGKYFEEHSIKECLKAHYATKKELPKSPSPTGRLTVSGAPPELNGTVTVELYVVAGKAEFIRLVS